LRHRSDILASLYPSFAGSWATAWIAKEAGYFSAEGLDVELIRVGGSTRMVAAMLGGSAPIIQAGAIAAFTANAAGAEVVIIGSTGTVSPFRLIARPEIKQPSDLRGKKAGITTFGSTVRSSRAHRFEAVRPGTEQRCHTLDVWRATRSLRRIATWRHTGGAVKLSTLPEGDEKRHA
jgi:hypothetical protein